MDRRNVGSRAALLLAVAAFLAGPGAAYVLAAPAPVAEWARTTVQASGDTWFGDVVRDGEGNLYLPGVVRTASVVQYGNGVTAVDPKPDSWNAVLVKYDASGKALWARSVAGTATDSEFRQIAMDASGNIYVVGYIGKGSYDFGNGVVATGVYPYVQRRGNVILVKYDAQGRALWARTTVSSADSAKYRGVAVDPAGNVYCVGILGKKVFDFGDGVTATGGANSDGTGVLVKYDPTGRVLWARAVPTGVGRSWRMLLEAVAVDASGNVYVAGGIGAAACDFGNGVTAKAPIGELGPVLAKYDPDGNALWASTAPFVSLYGSVGVDPSGSVYVTGDVNSNLTASFGNGVSVRAPGSGEAVTNMLLVKYDPSGAAQWARSITHATAVSGANVVEVDAAANVYVAGYLGRTGIYGFGDGVTAQGPYYGFQDGTLVGQNAFIVKYDSAGAAQWARSVARSASNTIIWGFTIDAAGHIYAAMEMQGGTVELSPGVAVSSSGNWVNAVLVKY